MGGGCGGGGYDGHIPTSSSFFFLSLSLGETSEKFFNLSGPDGDIVKGGSIEEGEERRTSSRPQTMHCAAGKSRESVQQVCLVLSTGIG